MWIGGDKMKDNYDLFSKSDMSLFFEDLEEEIKEQALNSSFDYTCENCGHEFQVTRGENICPNCEASIDVNVRFED